MKTILYSLLLILFSHLTIAQTTAIPDANFEQALISLGYDTGPIDGMVLTANINTVTSLNIDGTSISNTNLLITDLTGIEDFTSLTWLNCKNHALTSLNVSQNTALTYLDCTGTPLRNNIGSLDVTQNTDLVTLKCVHNQLSILDVTQNANLTSLDCFQNQLTSINLSQNTNLNWLDCSDNLLTGIDITQNINLIDFRCYNNQIASLDVSQNLSLQNLRCYNNQIIGELDLSQHSALRYIECQNNLFSCLNVKNGFNSFFFWFDSQNNPNLTCIEVDNLTYSNNNWTNIDAGASFSTSCPSPCNIITSVLNQDLIYFSLFPNPTTNQLIIETELELNEITIVDITGKTIMIIVNDFNTINVSDLPSGIYFTKLITEEKALTKKFVKQ